MSYDSRGEIAGKIDHEGGIWGALQYGLKVEDMPEGDEELRETWRMLRLNYEVADAWAKRVDALLPDPWEEP